MQRASFVTDAAGQVRFATGAGVDNRLQTWYRDDNDADWKMLNDKLQEYVENYSQKIIHVTGGFQL